MTGTEIYRDIAARTAGDIYIGVVGPVRTGKSTFITQFMNTLVLPNMEDETKRERAVDELPQSSAGRTIMTTEPKFIPEKGARISLNGNSELNVRLIDCVGYTVPSSIGYTEDDSPRMVMTPWSNEPVPFDSAAEIGTKKVIFEHSTIGLVVTTDGSISDIPRSEYAEAEQRVINELKSINKPFAVLLNCMYPESNESKDLAEALSMSYEVPVIPVNCLKLNENDIVNILSEVLYEFPVKQIYINYPLWINSLADDNELKEGMLNTIKSGFEGISVIRDIDSLSGISENNSDILSSEISKIDFGNGSAVLNISVDRSKFYEVLNSLTGYGIKDDTDLMDNIVTLSNLKKQYQKIGEAVKSVEETGYGIVMPDIDELKLEEPEIMKQGGRYGVRLKASAPSIHMMKANISTEVSPIVGTEKQSEDLIMYLLSEFEENPIKIWESNIFGKSLHELVNEGLHTKLERMPDDARARLRETIEKVINEGCSGLICIIL